MTKKVLVIDDIPDLIVLATLVLEQRGFDVIGVLSPDKIDWNDKPDVALIDVMMPKTNGEEIAHLIREHWPEIGIVAWTAGFVDVAKGAEEWADIVLTKPVDTDVLVGALRDNLRG